MQYTLRVNGSLHTVDVDSQKPLLWVLREELEDLNGSKYSCGIGVCGACTVLIDGVAYSSCTLTVDSVGDREITTIEGLDNKVGKALKEAWIEENVSQCGYCQPGQIVKAASLLTLNPNPTDKEIDEYMTNICRCGTYQRIRAAIKRAALSIGD